MSYTVDRTFTDDETFEWSLVLSSAGADPIDWEKYSAGYSLTRDGCVVALLTDDPGGGIAAHEIDGDLVLTLSAPALRLRPGAYAHGFRITERDTRKATQVFDGTITITEGNFR